MMREGQVVFALAASAFVLASGCRSKSTEPLADPQDADVAVRQETDAAPSIAPARCEAVTEFVALAAPEKSGDLSIGEALVTPSGFAIGILRAAAKGRVASIASVAIDFKSVTFADVIAARGDDPPPRALFLGDQSFALAYEHAPKRQITLFRTAPGKSEPVQSFADATDDSQAFDVVTKNDAGLLAWDDDAPGGVGVVKVARLTASSAGAVTAISKEGSDAEGPRVALRPGGYWVAWIARRAEPLPEGGAERIEGAGENRAFEWLELAALDGAGKRIGEVQRLTPQNGHLTSFDLIPSADGIDLFARDDGEAKDGEGAKIERITVHGDKSDLPVVVVKNGVGTGVPAASVSSIGGSLTAWLTYVDLADHTRLIPVQPGPNSPSLPSVEPALEGGRVLLATAPQGPLREGSSLLLALPTDEKRQIVRVFCGR
ncbi:MAG: hypothetical protein ABIP39_02575 [Polyangiaceae bacterium]